MADKAITREQLLYLLKHDEVVKEAVIEIIEGKFDDVLAAINAEKIEDDDLDI